MSWRAFWFPKLEELPNDGQLRHDPLLRAAPAGLLIGFAIFGAIALYARATEPTVARRPQSWERTSFREGFGQERAVGTFDLNADPRTHELLAGLEAAFGDYRRVRTDRATEPKRGPNWVEYFRTLLQRCHAAPDYCSDTQGLYYARRLLAPRYGLPRLWPSMVGAEVFDVFGRPKRFEVGS